MVTGRTETHYAREAIAEYIGDLEDAYLTEQRLIALRVGRTQAIALEDVMKTYGLVD